MNEDYAKELGEYHAFTKKELYNILADALEGMPKNFWKRRCQTNHLFDMGYYFNLCRQWVDYIEGKNDDVVVSKAISIRVLTYFSKFSKVQLPKNKSKIKSSILFSEEPRLKDE